MYFINMNQDVIDTLSFILASKHRTNIILSLEEKAKIPSQIGKEIDLNTTHVSKYLNSLKEKDLVKCLNETARKGRLYELTPKGKEYLNRLK